MNIIRNLINKNLILVTLAIWLIVSVVYFCRTPPKTRSTDWWGHPIYTKIISQKHRFPKPHEHWQTYNPPLYYIINSFISPSYFKTNITIHKNRVRLLSILYGAITLWIILWLLKQTSENKMAQFLAALFISTTPNFVMIFTTYNNDSLNTMLCVGLIALAHKLNKNWSWKYGLILLIVATAAAYTKYTSLWCFLTVCILCCTNLLFKKFPSKNQLKIISIFILAFCLFTPWLIFRNYGQTKKFFPFNDYSIFNKKVSLGLILNNAKERLKIPVLQQPPNTWNNPFVDPQGNPGKKFNYWSMTFIHSVINEWSYTFPPEELIYLLLWVHLIVNLITLRKVFDLNITKQAFLSILVIHLIHLIYFLTLRESYGLATAISYRFIAWSYAAWAILYSKGLSGKEYWSYILRRIFLIGIILQVYFLFACDDTNFIDNSKGFLF